jgi:Protein of unknown function (DUF2877)
MAASVAVADLLTGPRRPVEVVTVTPHAVYLATGDPDRPALCLATPDAIRLPFGLLAARIPLSTEHGTTGWVGDGRLVLGDFVGRLGRWWRPHRPRGLTAAGLRSVCVELAARVPEKLDPDAAAALEGLAAGGPPSRLLGLGPGLTPLGDDVLAGLLVTLGALGAPRFAPLGATVRALAPERTTFVSAALLRHAARGECVPQLAALLTGAPRAGAVDALLGVGHTSGAGLAIGVLAANHGCHNFPEVVASTGPGGHNFREVVATTATGAS